MLKDDLATYLNALEMEDNFTVDEILKESSVEITQRVHLTQADGTQRGPFVRKIIDRASGLGGVYEQLYLAQRDGRRFAYIPTVLECYANEDNRIVLMEFVSGETLQDVVYRCNPSLSLARQLFPMLCASVTELHEAFDPPIIHRDLKPSNIMVDGNRLTIIDFGIARNPKDNAVADTAHFGTRPFAPPEQFGFGQTTERSDVYALGMLLYFCLTETIPEPSVRDCGFNDERIPSAIREVLQRATAFDPDQRFASARDLRSAFELACRRDSEQSTPTRDPAPAKALIGTTPKSEQTTMQSLEPPLQAQPFFSLEPMLPTPAQSLPEAPERFAVLGGIWNAILGIAALFFIYICVYQMMFPEGAALEHTLLQNALSYLVFGPLFFLATALFLSDKRPMKRRSARIRHLRWWHWTIAYLIVFIICFMGIGLAFH